MMIYKNFGLMYEAKDSVLTIVGCISVLVFGFGWSFWISVASTVGFKLVMSILLLS